MAGPGRQHCTRAHPKQQVGTDRGHRDPAARGGHGRLYLHGAAPLHPAGTAQGRRSQSRGQGVSQPPPQREKLLPRCGDRSPLAGTLWPRQRCRPCCQHRMDTQLCCEMSVWRHTRLPPPGRPRSPCSPRQAGTSTSECKKPLWVPQPSPNPGLTLRPRPPGPPPLWGCGGKRPRARAGSCGTGSARARGSQRGAPTFLSTRAASSGAGAAPVPAQGLLPARGTVHRTDGSRPLRALSAPRLPCAGWGPSRVHPKPVLTAAARLSCLRTR